MSSASIMGRPLGAGDVAEAAKRLKVTEAHVRAVISIEANGEGFLGKYENDPRLPKILFEAHIFGRETHGQYHDSHPHLSSPTWNRDLYRRGLAEYDRLHEAAELNFDAAYRSASWGMFQVMGFNHAVAGYADLKDFIGVMHISEGMQLLCGVNFILTKGLDKPLRDENWAEFAKGYNGPDYSTNRYDEKLAGAFHRFQSRPLDEGEEIKEVQAALNALGYALSVDGKLGPRTEEAIRKFQEAKGLAVDGVAGPNTRRALGLT